MVLFRRRFSYVIFLTIRSGIWEYLEIEALSMVLVQIGRIYSFRFPRRKQRPGRWVTIWLRGEGSRVSERVVPRDRGRKNVGRVIEIPFVKDVKDV